MLDLHGNSIGSGVRIIKGTLVACSSLSLLEAIFQTMVGTTAQEFCSRDDGGSTPLGIIHNC